MITGKCSSCDRVLPFEEFPKSLHDVRGRKSNCRFCHSWKNSGREGNPKDFLHLEKDPCHICGNILDDKHMAIDHCHSSGTIRGRLCFLCNTGLGKFKDDVELLGKAIEYLKRYSDGERRKNSTIPTDSQK